MFQRFSINRYNQQEGYTVFVGRAEGASDYRKSGLSYTTFCTNTLAAQNWNVSVHYPRTPSVKAISYTSHR
jgi:hypothetical protein